MRLTPGSALLVSLVLAPIAGAQVMAQASQPLVPGVDAGLAMFASGDRAGAEAALLPYGHDDARAAYHLGTIALDLGHFGEAVDWFERTVALEPTSAVYWDKLGQAYAGHALEADIFLKFKLARRCKAAFEKAVALDSTSIDARTDVIEYYAQAPGIVGGDREHARALSATLEAYMPYYGAQSMLLVCRMSHDPGCVRTVADSLILMFPDSSLGYDALSQFYAEGSQFDSAFAVVDRRLATHPDDFMTLYQLGRVASMSGQRLPQAAQALARYIGSPLGTTPSRRSLLSGAHYRLGSVYQQSNQLDSARAEFERAVSLDARDNDAKKALRAMRE